MEKDVYVSRKRLLDLLFSKPYDVISSEGGGFSRTEILNAINSLDSIVVTKCEDCEFFIPPTNDPNDTFGGLGICKACNVRKKAGGACDDGIPKK